MRLLDGIRPRTTPATVGERLDLGRPAGIPCSIPSTLMSSSTSGQWTPCPAPTRRNLARCLGVASDSRQDHASGTLITRPSARCAMISFAVTRTSWISGSLVNSAAVLMPCLQYRGAVGYNDPSHLAQLPRADAVAAGKSG